ncbi:MAG TPA: PH domain-containing protein [Ornithinibacter sp.]|nr:PH domain-containing protein [Ornithinibacter sp.]
MSATGGHRGATASDAPFRPRRGRVMPLVMATVALLVCAGVALGMGASGGWTAGDQVTLMAFGAALAAFLWRYASIRAVPDADGLTVRNLVVTRRVTWDEVVEVTFAEGAPWVSLELADDDELAVMAVQRADGDLARAEAQRLADLVARHRGA